MKKDITRARIIIAVALFLGGLFLTELSPFSSRAVALVNGGYGTFDMKVYDAATFEKVMGSTKDFSIYWKYYICDFIFTAVFLNFMIQTVHGFHGKYIDQIKIVSYVFAAVRATLDITENIILLCLIYGFPEANSKIADVCNMITRVKFHFMRGWIVCFVAMIIISIVTRKLMLNKKFLR